MRINFRSTLIVLVMTLASAQFAHAAVTTQEPSISSDELELRLLPLTRDELAEETEAWRDLLKQKVNAISMLEIKSRSISDEIERIEEEGVDGENADTRSAQAPETIQDTKKQILDQLAQLREQKSMIQDRFVTVLEAYEAKGAPEEAITEYRQYDKAVSGVTVEISDEYAFLSAVQNWVASSEGGIKWAFRFLQFIAILVLFWVIGAFLGRLTRKATDSRPEMSALLKNFLGKFVQRAVLFLGFLMALSSVGVNVGALAAVMGGGAFILGFALQETLGNFAAGLMLLVYRPFDVGDVVEVGGVAGTVDNVSLVNTTIRSFDNKIILVPNKQVWGEVITNSTASHQRRVDLVFGIGYDDDIDRAREILEEIVSNHELILDNPKPTVEMNTLGESSVDFVCRPWTRTENYWRVYWDITKQVKVAFDEADINIPYPQRDIHIYQADPKPQNKPIANSSAKTGKVRDKLEDFPDSDTESEGVSEEEQTT